MADSSRRNHRRWFRRPLRRAGAPAGAGADHVLDRRNHHVFQPLLYQVATAVLSPGDIASPIRWILRRQRNTEVLLAEVVGSIRERKRSCSPMAR